MLGSFFSPKRIVFGPGSKKMGGVMKKIDFEAHFYTQQYIDTLYQSKGYPRMAAYKKTGGRRLWYNDEVGQPFADFLLNALLDLGEKRIERMDKCGIDIQILSLSAPGWNSSTRLQVGPSPGTLTTHFSR